MEKYSARVAAWFPGTEEEYERIRQTQSSTSESPTESRWYVGNCPACGHPASWMMVNHEDMSRTYQCREIKCRMDKWIWQGPIKELS